MVHTTAGRTVGMLRANERQRLNILFRNPHYLAKEVKNVGKKFERISYLVSSIILYRRVDRVLCL